MGEGGWVIKRPQAVVSAHGIGSTATGRMLKTTIEADGGGEGGVGRGRRHCDVEELRLQSFRDMPGLAPKGRPPECRRETEDTRGFWPNFISQGLCCKVNCRCL